MWTIDPLRDFDQLRREVDRLFEGFAPATRRLAAGFLPGRSARAYPLVNITENEAGYTVDALAPGIDPKSLQVSVKGSQLTIAGEKVAVGEDVKPEAWHRSERASGRFTRVITLPTELSDDKVQAVYRDGVLRLTLPKAEHALPRKIAIQVA